MNPEIPSFIFKDRQQESLFSLGPEVVHLPKTEITIAYGAWGESLDNEQLINRFGFENDRELIENTRITRRHHNLPPLIRNEGDPLFPPEVIEEQISVGAKTTEKVIEVNGWGKPDLLVITVSLPPCPDFPEQIAERIGLKGVETKLYCLACNGAVAAWHDILRLRRWERVVITAVEGLSIGVDFKDSATAAIFGNGVASIAFSTPEIELIGGKTVIQPDTEGVIKVPKAYNLPPKEERWPLEKLPWYEFREGAEEKFAFTDRAVMMLMPESEDPYYNKMKGPGTVKLFGRLVPPVACSVLKEIFPRISIWPNPLLIVSHQPSNIPHAVISKGITKGWKRIGDELGVKVPDLYIPWILDKVGMGNVSSATPLVGLAHLAKEGQVPKGRPFKVLGIGVGASVTGMAIEIK